MPLIGTAGHVDHGKSSLIQRLTGRDPDRWAEEKTRGMTIDLGFAWAPLDDGTEVSFVDVPGHERFLKNMLAGIEAIDAALLVVAADEGWMPQSEEHLAVLDLLGVTRGVVALTKLDLVDAETLEIAHLEVLEQLTGTGLEGVPVVGVSTHTGEGVDELWGALKTMTAGIKPRDTSRPRLWVDRSFSATGSGTVVTGTLLDGLITVEDQVVILPRGIETRIRRIQSHEKTHDRIGPGRRVALNLASLEREEVARGDMVASPGQWELSNRFVVNLRLARYTDEIDDRGAYQLHVGSGAHRVEILGQADGIAIFGVPNPLPLAVGDRYILRDTGRRRVVGGGRVLDPNPGPTRRALTVSRVIDPETTADDIATRLLEIRGAEKATKLAAHSGGGRPTRGREVAGVWLTEERIADLHRQAVRMVTAYLGEHPLREGLPLATLARRLDVGAAVAEVIAAESAELVRSGPDVTLAGRSAELSDEQARVWAGAQPVMESTLAVPTPDELGLTPEVVHLLVRRGDLVRVDADLLYPASQVETLTGLIRSMPEDFTVADFRDAAGLSRKYAVPILEWADREGLTVRRGDTRRARITE